MRLHCKHSVFPLRSYNIVSVEYLLFIILLTGVINISDTKLYTPLPLLSSPNLLADNLCSLCGGLNSQTWPLCVSERLFSVNYNESACIRASVYHQRSVL